MSESNDKETVMTLPGVRLSFPILFQAKAFGDDPNGKKDFSASFLFPKTAAFVADIRAALLATATAKWGAKAPEVLAILFRDDRLCLHDGDKKDYEGYAGNFYLRASNQVRPLVIDRAKNPITEKDGKIYSGCFVNGRVSFWAQENKWGKRVNANLRGVQFFADGEAFTGGGTASNDEFEDESGNAENSVVGSELSGLGF